MRFEILVKAFSHCWRAYVRPMVVRIFQKLSLVFRPMRHSARVVTEEPRKVMKEKVFSRASRLRKYSALLDGMRELFPLFVPLTFAAAMSLLKERFNEKKIFERNFRLASRSYFQFLFSDLSLAFSISEKIRNSRDSLEDDLSRSLGRRNGL